MPKQQYSRPSDDERAELHARQERIGKWVDQDDSGANRRIQEAATAVESAQFHYRECEAEPNNEDARWTELHLDKAKEKLDQARHILEEQ